MTERSHSSSALPSAFGAALQRVGFASAPVPLLRLASVSSSIAAVALAVGLGTVTTGCPGEPEVPPPSEDGARGYGRVADFTTGIGVEGLDVCNWVDGETGPCAETDGNGEFILEGLPENENNLLLFEKFSHFPLLGHWNTSDEDVAWDVPLPDEGIIDLNTSLATDGDAVERGMGQVFFTTRIARIPDQPGRAGIFISPAPGSAAMGEPVYGNSVGLPDVNQVGTSGIGSAVFSNVPPGQYEVVVTGDCVPFFSHLPTGENEDTYPITVVANMLSTMTIACEEP